MTMMQTLNTELAKSDNISPSGGWEEKDRDTERKRKCAALEVGQ